MLRPVLFHVRAKEEIRAFPRDVRLKLGSALMALQRGFNLGPPLSRAMSILMPGVEELRLRVRPVTSGCSTTEGIRGRPGAERFHKKTRETPVPEIARARRRLMEMLNEYEEDRARS